MLVGQWLQAEILLFDMDGTLIDATSTVERIWTRWAARYGVDVAQLLAASRGQRVADTVRIFAPLGTDVAAEEAWLSRQAHAETMGLKGMPGAPALLRSLPPSRWAVVTSAERSLAVKWLASAGLPTPSVLVAAGDVTAGKPHPAGYALAAQLLGYDASRAVVFEDAALGVEAGCAAGAKVVGIANSSLASDTRIEFWVPDFVGLRLEVDARKRITLRQAH